jgi:hypothetical protein
MRTTWATLILGLAVSLALLGAPVLPAWAGPAATGDGRLAAAQVEPGAGAWPTWLIAATTAEMAELGALAAQRAAAALDRAS